MGYRKPGSTGGAPGDGDAPPAGLVPGIPYCNTGT